MENITIVDFSDGKANKTVTNAPYQWSYGQILRITGLELPDGIEIHFSLSEKVGIAYRAPGTNKDGATEVKIPQFIFENEGTRRESYKGYVFIYPSDPDSGETTHKIILNIKTRPRPEDYIYNEEELATYKALEKRILDLEGNQTSDETIKEAVEDYLERNPVEIEVDQALSELSENPVQNKAVAKKIKEVEGKIPTDYVSEEELESKGYLTEHQDISNLAPKATTLAGYGITDGALKADIPTKPEQVGADVKGTANSKVSEHNISDSAHNDIRLLIKNLTTKITALLDSDDETLDQTSEIVTYIKSNKSLIDAITTSKVSVSDIVDNLTTNVKNKPLSSAQGVALKSLIDDIQTALTNITVPTKLPNPNKLIFEGAVSAEYDGSETVTVTIPRGYGAGESSLPSVTQEDDGKILRVANGEWEVDGNLFTVTISEDEEFNYICDKKFSEISQAIEDGKSVQCSYFEQLTAPLLMYAPDGIIIFRFVIPSQIECIVQIDAGDNIDVLFTPTTTFAWDMETPSLLGTSGLIPIYEMIFHGCTSSKSGSLGFVPAPNRGDQDKVLAGDGTWKHIEGSLPTVSETDNGKVLQVVNGVWATSEVMDGNTKLFYADENEEG